MSNVKAYPISPTNYFFLGAAFGAAFLPDFAGEGFAAGFPADFACAISIEFK